MTRGCHTNYAYIIFGRPEDPPCSIPQITRTLLPAASPTVCSTTSGPSCRPTRPITTEHDQWASIAQPAAGYETIVAAAQRNRWAALIQCSGLTSQKAAARRTAPSTSSPVYIVSHLISQACAKGGTANTITTGRTANDQERLRPPSSYRTKASAGPVSACCASRR